MQEYAQLKFQTAHSLATAQFSSGMEKIKAHRFQWAFFVGG